MKRFFLKKVKGYIITFEIGIAALLWAILMTSTVYIINLQKNQKMMYDAFISVSVQACKWGGTSTNIYNADGRYGMDIAKTMEAQIEELTGQDITIIVSPTKITPENSKITVQMSWKDKGFWFIPSKTHTLKESFDSCVEPGLLL